MMAANKGETSSFSQTCRLLSQFLKEKKASLGSLALDMAPNCKSLAPRTMSLLPGLEEQDGRSQERSPPKSMHLLPQNPALTSMEESDARATTEKDEEEEKENKKKPQQQLTIFYGGKVLVFDDFPADKAKNLMEMATKLETIAAQNFGLSSIVAGRAADCPPKSVAPPPLPPPAHAQDKANASDMPIARRNSLHRFLEKRKDRISTKAPYQVHRSIDDETKLESGPSWLNLGNQAPALVVGLENN